MSATSSRTVSLWGIDPETYVPHRLHAPGRTYLETNCYADALIELLHARGDEPLAMFGYIVATDWEGDQFSYAKPRYADLERLFGIEIHKMLPYRTCPSTSRRSSARTHCLSGDRLLVASRHRRHHLPPRASEDDGRPGDDRPRHERMRYFHNAGVFELGGDDYRGAFRMLPQFTADVMDPFTEVVRFDAGPRLAGGRASPGGAHPARRPLLAAPAAQPVRFLGPEPE